MTIVPSSIQQPSVVDYGIESGLNTQSIIQAELQPYQQPETDLKNQQATSSGWNARQATSSDDSVVTATANPGTPAGTLQFVVQQLATASSLVSTGTVASTSQIVDTEPSLLVAQGGS